MHGTFDVVPRSPRLPGTRRMSWKEPSERHSDAIIEAIDKASHRVATAIEKGFIHMADVQAQALQDLSVAVANLSNAVADELAALTAALAAQGIDDSPQIEASVGNINNLVTQLKNSVAPSVPTGVTTPGVTTTAPAAAPAQTPAAAPTA